MMIIFLVTLMIEMGRTSMIESSYTAMYLLLDDSYYYWFIDIRGEDEQIIIQDFDYSIQIECERIQIPR